MKIAIKNAAPVSPDQQSWGDLHFGAALKRALEKVSASTVVFQHYWPEWNQSDEEDVAIVLRGKRWYKPTNAKVSLLWIISHPATVSAEELSEYTVVYATSHTLKRRLEGITNTPIRVLRQCTDGDLFYPPEYPIEEDARRRQGHVFVANTRGVLRDMVQWGLDANRPPSIIGRGWKGVGVGHLVKQKYVHNPDLPDFYRTARLGVNDHWADMRYHGIISNRVFDCLASGLPIISDRFPELEELFGDNILYVSNGREYRDAMDIVDRTYSERLEKARQCAEWIRREFSFVACAEQIMRDALNPPGRNDLTGCTRHPGKREQTKVFVLQELVAALLEAVNGTGAVDAGLRTIHLSPTATGSWLFMGDARFKCVTAGAGVGPWQVALDHTAYQLDGGSRDLLLIEDAEGLKDIPETERNRFVRALGRCLRKGGLIGIVLSSEGRLWRQIMDSAGFREIRSTERWVIFSPPAEKGTKRKRAGAKAPTGPTGRSCSSRPTATHIKLVETAAHERDWPLLLEVGESALGCMEDGKAKARVAAAYVGALRKMHRYVGCVEAFEKWWPLLLEYGSRVDVAGALARYCESLLRLERWGDVLAAVQEMPRRLLDNAAVAAACTQAALHSGRAVALFYGHHAVAHATKNKAQYLGRLAYAYQAYGADIPSIRRAVESWKEVKLGARSALTYGGYIDAALACRENDHDSALEALNRELEAKDLAPVNLEGGKNLSLDGLCVRGALSVRSDGPLVTVLMSARDAERYIDTAIGAVLGQTHGKLELVVIDDGSTDTTRARAASWRRRDSRIRVVALEHNRGVYAARNVGLMEARGDYITTHDADDWSHPQRLERQLQAIREQDAVACISGWIRIDETGRVHLWGNGQVLHHDLSSLMFAREVFDRLGYFDPVVASGDSEYRSRIHLTYGPGAIAELTDCCLAFGRLHSSSLTSTGLFAYDAFRYNRRRALYLQLFRSWQLQQLRAGEVPYMECALEARKFWAPMAICAPLGMPVYRRVNCEGVVS